MTAVKPIYLDHNATTPVDPAVVEAMNACHRQGLANPASPHAAGRHARQLLEQARQGVARILGANTRSRAADRLIFTSGGTEANNLALRGLAGDAPTRLIVSAIEHPSTLAAAAWMRRCGWLVDTLRSLPNGQIDLDHLRELLSASDPPPRLVSVMLANNETGVLQPVPEVVNLCRAEGILIHCDAVQVAGKLPLDFRALDVDALTIAAHKFHGPAGIGALLLRHGVSLQPLLFGGHQQLGLRPGTEPVALAAGMHAALQLWEQQAAERTRRLRHGRDTFEHLLRQGDPGVVMNGEEPRVHHTSNVSFLGLDRQALWMALDLAGVQCATGSACASGASEPSHVLRAMGLEAARTDSALRFSLGVTTTIAEVEQAVDRILSTMKHLRPRILPPNSSASPREARSKAV